MNKLLLLILVLFLAFNAYSQSLKFIDANPLWISYADSQNEDDSVFQYISRSPLILGNDIYLSYNLIRNSNSGYLVEKIDLSNGNKLWSSRILVPDLVNREYLDYMDIDANDNLRLYAFHQLVDNGQIAWGSARFSKRLIDVATGRIVESFLSDSVRLFRRSYPTINSFRKFRYHEKGYQYLSFSPNGDIIDGLKTLISSKVMRMDSIVKDTSLTIFSNLKLVSFDYDFFTISKDTSVLLIHSRDGFDFRDQLVLYFLDQNLNMLQELDFSEDIERFDSYKYSIDYIDDGFILLKARFRTQLNPAEDKRLVKRAYYLFSRSGQLVEKIVLDIDEFTGDKFSDSVIRLKGTKNMAIIANHYDEKDYATSYFLKSNGFGGVDTLKTFVSFEKNDVVIPRQLVELDNKNILLNFDHREKKSPNLKSVLISQYPPIQHPTPLKLLQTPKSNQNLSKFSTPLGKK